MSYVRNVNARLDKGQMEYETNKITNDERKVRRIQ